MCSSSRPPATLAATHHAPLSFLTPGLARSFRYADQIAALEEQPCAAPKMQALLGLNRLFRSSPDARVAFGRSPSGSCACRFCGARPQIVPALLTSTSDAPLCLSTDPADGWRADGWSGHLDDYPNYNCQYPMATADHQSGSSMLHALNASALIPPPFLSPAPSDPLLTLS